MTDRASVNAWVAAYERAWRSPGTDALTSLFTDSATYSMDPYGEPVRGLDAIAELWERERTGPGEPFTMRAQVVAVEGDIGVVRVEVDYHDGRQQQYRDLWIIHFARDGRCDAFEEWPFWPGKGHGP
jgi:ketosteroid isomerase-like protein